MLAILASPAVRFAAVAIGAAMFIGAAYLKGRTDGIAVERSRAISAVFDQIEERNITNEQIRDMSDAQKCSAIGGVYSDGQCR